MMHSGRAFSAAKKLILISLLACAALIAFAWLAYYIGSVLRPLTEFLIALWIAFVAFVLWFFRDPDPIAPSVVTAIVSPAHGTVDLVDETVESQFIGGPCRRISIFLSVFDVHVQNAPVTGRVQHLQHKAGLFLNAMRSDCAEHNEQVMIGIEPLGRPAGEKVAVCLIAGLIARRIIPWIKAGETIDRSQRISLIQFGSRVNLYLPLNAKIEVAVGSKVVGGQTVLAHFG